MATSDKLNIVSGVAGADLSTTATYSLLMQHSTAGQYVVTTGNTDIPVAVLRTGATSGLGIEMYLLEQGKIVPMVASAAINLGAKVSPAASGKVVTDDAGAGDTIVGIAVEAAGADGDVIGVRVLTYES
jgi:hypothetical protein